MPRIHAALLRSQVLLGQYPLAAIIDDGCIRHQQVRPSRDKLEYLEDSLSAIRAGPSAVSTARYDLLNTTHDMDQTVIEPFAQHGQGRSGRQFSPVEPVTIPFENIALVGLHWGAYQLHDPAAIDAAMAALFALYERGEIKPLVSERFPLVDAAAGLARITGRKSVGKIVLQP